MARTVLTLLIALVACPVLGETYRFEGVAGTITGHGAAIAVGKRTAVTCFHLLKDRNYLVVDGRRVEATVVSTDEDLDFAVVSVPVDLDPYEVGELRDGGLSCVSFPMAGPRTEARAEVTAKMKIWRVCASKGLSHGSSGGAVVQGGRVVGMIVSVFSNIADEGAFLPTSRWPTIPRS